MRSTFHVRIAALTVVVAMSPLYCTAQEARAQKSTLYHHDQVVGRSPAAQKQPQAQQQKHSRYKVIDLGTFGGPNSYVQEELQVIKSQGTVAGLAETTI